MLWSIVRTWILTILAEVELTGLFTPTSMYEVKRANVGAPRNAELTSLTAIMAMKLADRCTVKRLIGLTPAYIVQGREHVLSIRS